MFLWVCMNEMCRSSHFYNLCDSKTRIFVEHIYTLNSEWNAIFLTLLLALTTKDKKDSRPC